MCRYFRGCFLTYICEDEGAFKRFDPAQNSNRMSLTVDTLQAERKKRKIPGNVPNLTTRLPTFQVSVVVVHWEGNIEARIYRHAINASKDEPTHRSEPESSSCMPSPCAVPQGLGGKGAGRGNSSTTDNIKMHPIIAKHCDPRIEKFWFKPHKTTLSKEEISSVFRNRDRLRENATKHEIEVAKYLDEMDVYFIPQLPVFCANSRTTFWADLFIPRNKVVIEVDGNSHRRIREMTKDAYRDAEFKARGMEVIRIKNKDVDDGSYKVILQDIIERCKCRHHKRHEHGQKEQVGGN